ncbi:MAG: SWIM zinc finger family protein [Candidatus Thiodiazotropha sp.]
MTLRSMMLSYDRLALESLTSKGLLRRAQKDVDSGLVRIDKADEKAATISVGEETVEVDENGPKSASCTCKAHGICRHIVAAVLMLRTQQSSVEETSDESQSISASKEICALTEEQVIKFSGADWSKSLALMSGNLQVNIHEEGLNVAVLFEDMDAKVTFIGGSGLKGAAYKGPKTRKRLLSTVAALLVRQNEGLQLSESSHIIGDDFRIDDDFINNAQQIIEQAASVTLLSRSPIGQDLLLELSISSRCESLPRLSAELRALAQQSRAASERNINFDTSTFLLQSSRTYALLEALRVDPSNQILTGSIKREYKIAKPMEVWPLAVSRWRSRTGARGLSAYLFNPVSCEWLTMLEGRSAGTDLSFDVSTAYQMSVLGSSTLSGIMGRRVHLTNPMIASDGSISKKSQDSRIHKQALTLEEILKSKGSHNEWRSFRNDVETRIGQGICRRQVPLPALIIPSGYGRIGFDDVNQIYTYEVRDKHGDSLILSIPADDNQTAIRLGKMGREVQGIVVETSLGNDGIQVRPVSFFVKQSSGISIHNIDFDYWKSERGIKKVISKFRESVANKPLLAYQTNKSSPFKQTLSDSIDELVNLTSSSPITKETRLLVRRLESIGCSTFADSFEKAIRLKDLRSIFKAGFLASEIDAMLKF